MKRAPHRPASEWQNIIAQFDSGADSEREFCAKHAIKLVTLRKWRYHFKSAVKKDSEVEGSSGGFAKVHVRSPAADSTPKGITLRLGSEIRLECPPSFDVRTVAQLALDLHRGR